MDLNLSLLPWLLAALLGAAVAWLAMAGALHLSAVREHGFMHWVMPALLAVMAAGVWLSGRDLTSNFLLPEFAPDPPRPPLLNTLQPVVSLLLLAISTERILSHWLARAQHGTQQILAPALPLAFVLFWLGTIAAPAWAAAHPYWSHNLLYPLFIGLAASLCGPREYTLALRATRNALLLLMLAGVLLIPIAPTLVLDRQYGQGLIPGLPRFGGLATHPVAMGLLAQLGLLCLQMQALERRWLNRCAWLLGLGVLFMAQSKTAWLAFALCSGSVLALRWAPRLRAQLGHVHDATPALAWIALALLGVAASLGLLVFGNLGESLQRFLLSSEGSQLSSMTGRDRIWVIAWEEWQLHPVWGWGLQMWDDSYRRAIGMANATHAHNQLMDTLSRSGLVGAAALALYVGVLGVLSLRCARASQGLSLALLLALLLRAGSEVPLLLIGYGPDLLIHLLLLITLAAHRSAPVHASRRWVTGGALA
jgi:O-antigen ligase